MSRLCNYAVCEIYYVCVGVTYYIDATNITTDVKLVQI